MSIEKLRSMGELIAQSEKIERLNTIAESNAKKEEIGQKLSQFRKKINEIVDYINKKETHEKLKEIVGSCVSEVASEKLEVKMFLFARWMATCYADTHMDSKMKSEHDEGFDSSEAMSVLNRQTGHWYQEQLKHFCSVVYPNYIKNGTVENTKLFLEGEIKNKFKQNVD